MNLQRLEGFYWVAKERGYTRAARAFPYPISQPGVYQQVKKLEDELAVVLFERVAKDEVRLTPAGERLFAFCAPFFEQLPSVLDALASDGLGGMLRMDASGLVLRQLLPDWVRRIRSAHPGLVVDVAEIQTVDFARLRSGASHLVVDFCESIPRELCSRRVATSFSFLVVPRVQGRKRPFALAELAKLPFVSYHPSLPHHRIQMQAVRQHLGEPQRTTSASSVDAILAFVSAGIGFSVIPWLDRHGPKLRDVVARRVSGPGTTFPIHAVWRSDSHLADAALAALSGPERPRAP